MPIIIWGSRGLSKTVAHGDFDCPRCGRVVSAQFNFCPTCQYNLRPNCPQCRRQIRPGDHFCPHCGFGLESGAPAASLQPGAQPAG